MHEVSIMRSTMVLILEEAIKNNLSKIEKITCHIGELSGVLPQALQFAFQSASQGTSAEGANFEMRIIKALAHCQQCEKDYAIDHYQKLCPTCGEYSTNIVSGYELLIQSIEGA